MAKHLFAPMFLKVSLYQEPLLNYELIFSFEEKNFFVIKTLRFCFESVHKIQNPGPDNRD